MRKLREKRKRKTYLHIAVILLMIVPAMCRAELIEIGFSGGVNVVDDPYNLLENGVQEGASISGYYIYESLASDTSPATSVGDYWHASAPYGIYTNVGELIFQTNSAEVDFLVEIINNHGIGENDGYLISSYNNLNINNDVIVDAFAWQLDDYSGTAILSTDLPDFPPDLTAWQSGNNLQVSGGRGGTPPHFDEIFQINGRITSVWLIPEPATLFLFSLGWLFLRKRS